MRLLLLLLQLSQLVVARQQQWPRKRSRQHFGGGGGGCSGWRQPPHIVLIVADDLGFNDVSWHNPDMQTPHLAELAATGVTLEQHYAQPKCAPSRAALLTGQSSLT